MVRLVCTLILVVSFTGVGHAAWPNSCPTNWWQRAAQTIVNNVKREAAVQIAVLSASATTFSETYSATGSARQALGRAAQTALIAETVYYTFTGPLTMLTR